jgi:hypothetical protein
MASAERVWYTVFSVHGPGNSHSGEVCVSVVLLERRCKSWEHIILHCVAIPKMQPCRSFPVSINHDPIRSAETRKRHCKADVSIDLDDQS